MNRLFVVLRYELPLYLVLRLTNWLPDYLMFIEFRGFLVSFCIKSCGNRLRVQRNVSISSPNCLLIGSKVTIAYGCWLSAPGIIEIEDNCGLSPYVCLSSTGFQYEEGKPPIPVTGKIVIKEGAWVGAHSTILKDVIIGEKAIIAANSLVNRNIPRYSVYGGSPIKRIVQRVIIEDGKN